MKKRRVLRRRTNSNLLRRFFYSSSWERWIVSCRFVKFIAIVLHLIVNKRKTRINTERCTARRGYALMKYFHRRRAVRTRSLEGSQARADHVRRHVCARVCAAVVAQVSACRHVLVVPWTWSLLLFTPTCFRNTA